MPEFLPTVLFVAEVIAPIFLIVLIGAGMRAAGIITERFVDDASRVAFLIPLPALVFMAIVHADLGALFQPDVITFFIIGTLLSFALVYRGSRGIARPEDRGVFVQGVYRGNFGVVGLALAQNVFGAEGLAKGAMILVFLIPLYNTLAILALTLPFRRERGLEWGGVLLKMVKNPLILAAAAAFPLALYQIPLPPILEKTGGYLARLAIPLALLCAGGSLSWSGLKAASGLSLSASALKLIALPLATTLAALALGFSGSDVVFLFLIFSCPSAAAGFIMAKGMGGNGELAGNIIVVSTAASAVTIGIGLFLLRWGGVL